MSLDIYASVSTSTVFFLQFFYSQVLSYICVKRTLCCVNIVYTRLQGLNGKSVEITRSLDQRDGREGILEVLPCMPRVIWVKTVVWVQSLNTSSWNWE